MNAPIRPQQKAAPVATQEILDEEDKGFELVEDNANVMKKKQQKPTYPGQYNQGWRGRGGAGAYRGRGGNFGGRGGARPW